MFFNNIYFVSNLPFSRFPVISAPLAISKNTITTKSNCSNNIPYTYLSLEFFDLLEVDKLRFLLISNLLVRRDPIRNNFECSNNLVPQQLQLTLHRFKYIYLITSPVVETTVMEPILQRFVNETLEIKTKNKTQRNKLPNCKKGSIMHSLF